MSIATQIGRIAKAKKDIKEVVNQDFEIINNETIDKYAEKMESAYDEYESYIPWEHGEGSEFTFKKGGSGSYLKELEINGNTEQSSYTGKNLLPNSKQSREIVGVTFTSNEDGTYLINGKNTSTTQNAVVYIHQGEYHLPAGTYYNIPTGDTQVTVTLNATYEDDSQQYIDATNPSGSFAINKNIKSANIYIQVRKGTETTYNNFKVYPIISITPVTIDNYEPYVGGVPSPNPDYPQDIRVVENKQVVNVSGKNLLDTKVFENRIINCYVVNDNGTVTQTATDTNFWQSSYLPNSIILNRGTYTISVNDRNGSTLQIYNLTTNSNIVERKADNYTFTLNNDNQVINVKLYGASSYPFTFTMQLEESNQTTEYEPYHNQDYEIDLHGKNFIEGSNDFSGTWNNSQNWETDTNSYNNLIVKKNQGTWNGMNKEIYIIAGTYTFSLFAKSDSARTANIYLGGTLTTDNLVPQSKQLNLTTEWQRYDVTFTSNANGTIKPRLENPTGISGNYTYICGYQLEKNSTATEYEPYYDYKLCKIDTYKDSIKKSTGKNLFNGEWSNGSIGSNGQNISDSKSIRTTGIGVKSGVQYTFSSSTTTSINEFWINYYNDDTFVSREYLSSGNTKTFIVPSGVNIARFRLTATTDININIINNVQIEQNSQATSYEPFGTDWYIKKEIGKVVLDGSENSWGVSSTGNYFYINKNDMRKSSGGWEIAKAYSNNYYPYSFNNIYNGTPDYGLGIGYNSSIMAIKHKDITSKDDFKTWLSTHNTEVYYVLTTPTYEIITNETLINQLKAIEKLDTYNNYTAVTATGDLINPELECVLFSQPAYQKWVNNKEVN